MRQLARVFGVTLLVVLGGPSVLLASDIHVPADYATIQAAIDASVAGDVVLVSPGTYYENIDFKGKAITVQSTDGAVTTAIDGGSIDTVVKFVSGEGSDSVFTGFHITNGYGPLTGAHAVGGGVTCWSNSNPTISYCTIDGNTATLGGGMAFDTSSPTVDHCAIVGNQSTNYGGGIYCYSASFALISACYIANNSSGQGGGIASGSYSSPLIVNTIIAGNDGGTQGGGIIQIDLGLTLVNCVVWGNTAGEGSGVYAWASTFTAWNSVFWNNDFHTDFMGYFDVRYSDFSGAAGYNNIDADPLFADPSNGDFHLTASSPCIDAGSSTAPNLPSVDFEGDPRIVGPTPDMGADECAIPRVTSISINRGRYDQSTTVSLQGRGFSIAGGVVVSFGTNDATNVNVSDDGDLSCDAPTGEPGFVDVGVTNVYGEGILPAGFTYTPATTLDGTFAPGGAVNVHYLCDPLDGIFAIYGLPPVQSIPTPPYHGDLGILPFNALVYIPSWPFNDLTISGSIPNDPSLSGVSLLIQALIGPSLTKQPKDGAWTNCAVLTIQ